tara:strand:+ start:714 stop:1490 length:777 start_codon:yes stop_codon:yes gene_type:complete
MRNNVKEIAVVTYTHSNCTDLWRIYFGQLDEYAPNIKSYVFVDQGADTESISDRHQIVFYDDDEPYYKQYCTCLQSVSEEYVIYCQEDFFLQSEPDIAELERCRQVLENNEDYAFVRLVKTNIGANKHYSECMPRDWEVIELDENIYCAHATDFDAFSFQMQATLWDKQRMINLYQHVASQKWLENRKWDKGVRETGTKGAYYYARAPQEGPYHWEPEVWPYVCTAVGRGKWTLSVHGDRLMKILNEYNVDINIRGVR